MDRQTDRIPISISRVSMLKRDKKEAIWIKISDKIATDML